MKVAIVAGKYSGCGVSTYLFELQKAINNYIGECDYYVYNPSLACTVNSCISI